MNYFDMPLEKWTNSFVDDWLLPVTGDFFDSISEGLRTFIDGVTDLLIAVPPELLVLILVLLSWKMR
jgi:glycine betaine/proline transport system permease protein